LYWGFRAVLGSHWYQAAFPDTRIGPYKDSETEIELTHRGFRLSTSTGGTLTGRGGDVIVVDDPTKPIDALSDAKRTATNEWFRNTLLSRLDDKRTGAIVIVMQRVHMDDLTGFVLNQSPHEWTVLSLPAIAKADERIPLTLGRVHHRHVDDVLSPVREPMEVLEQLRLQLGSDLFSAQYQQAPVPPGGLMIKRHWVKRYVEAPPPRTGNMVIQSWDTAAKGGPDNDWSVCTTWVATTDFQFYLRDAWRGRVDYPTLKAKVQELANRWGAHQVLIEEAGTALGLLDELKYHVRGVTGVKPERDKHARMAIACSVFEAGQVHFPEQAPWLPELEAELFSFPGGRHDDQVDSISQAINHTKGSGLWKWLKFGESLSGLSPPTSQPAYFFYVNPFSRARW
jgi:predicted phage terminase large subunit-like protein